MRSTKQVYQFGRRLSPLVTEFSKNSIISEHNSDINLHQSRHAEIMQNVPLTRHSIFLTPATYFTSPPYPIPPKVISLLRPPISRCPGPPSAVCRPRFGNQNCTASDLIKVAAAGAAPIRSVLSHRLTNYPRFPRLHLRQGIIINVTLMKFIVEEISPAHFTIYFKMLSNSA